MAFQVSSKNSNDIESSKVRRDRVMLWTFLIVIVVNLLIFYFGFVNKSSIVFVKKAVPIESNSKETEDVIKNIDFDVSFFDNSFFEELKFYGNDSFESDVESESKGRAYPFLPF